jgi:hypothetical protein
MEPDASAPVPRESDHALSPPVPFLPRKGLNDLVDWWQREHAGVAVVHGIAGGGKTALAGYFLSLVRGLRTVPQDRTLIPPEREFVFSFRQLPDPIACVERLRGRLPPSPTAPRPQPSFYTDDDGFLREDPGPPPPPPDDSLIGRLKASTGSLLIVLDALEEVQVPLPGGDGTSWQIGDPQLRELFSLVASGEAANVAILATTRLPLAVSLAEGAGSDSGGRQSEPFVPVEADRFERPDESVLLLREMLLPKGLVAPDTALHQIAKACVHHPLSLAAAAEQTDQGDPLAILTFDYPCSLRLRSTSVPPGSRRCAEVLGDIVHQYSALLARWFPDARKLLDHLRLFECPVNPAALRQLLARSKLSLATRLDAAVATLKAMRLLVLEGPEESLAIHPLLRLSTATGRAARSRRIAVKETVESLIVRTPLGGPPSDCRRLDLLEELLRQSLADQDLAGAWSIYRHRMGGHAHLGRRLGDHRRGERVARLLFSESSRCGRDRLTRAAARDWLLYLMALGRLVDAEIAWEPLQLSAAPLAVSRIHALQVRVQLLTARGHLIEALATIELALATVPPSRTLLAAECAAVRAHLLSLQGRLRESAEEFAAAGRCGHPLGIEHVQFLFRLAPGTAVSGLVHDLKELLDRRYGPQSFEGMRCDLLAVELLGEADVVTAEERLDRVQEWAGTSGSRELACWERLVRGRVLLSDLKARSKRGALDPETRERLLDAALRASTEGLNVARSCGYGIYYIDLLLNRARLHLLRGDAAAAEVDSLSASRDGLPGNPELCLPLLLPATDRRCCYAWGEAAARQTAGEALVLMAPQFLTRRSEAAARGYLTAMQRARAELRRCKRLRQRMGDPELSATEKFLEGLSRQPDQSTPSIMSRPGESQHLSTTDATPLPRVLVSYNRRDGSIVSDLVARLRTGGIEILMDIDMPLGEIWSDRLEHWITTAEAAIIAVGPNQFGWFQKREVRACRTEMDRRGMRLIPVLLPSARLEVALSPFLLELNYLDMSSGLTNESIERLLRDLRAGADLAYGGVLHDRPNRTDVPQLSPGT